jgi:hypothetical protein
VKKNIKKIKKSSEMKLRIIKSKFTDVSEEALPAAFDPEDG